MLAPVAGSKVESTAVAQEIVLVVVEGVPILVSKAGVPPELFIYTRTILSVSYTHLTLPTKA